MNRRLVLCFTSIAFASLVLIACVAAAPGGSAPVGSAPGGSASGGLFQSPVTTPPAGSGSVDLDFAFDMPPALGQPVTGTLTVVASQDQPTAKMIAGVRGPKSTTSEQAIGPLIANQPKQIPIGFQFAEEGRYDIVILVQYGYGAIADYYQGLEVSRSGVVINPTAQILAPASAPASIPTSGPTSTPHPANTPLPGATPTESASLRHSEDATLAPDALINLSGSIDYDDRADPGNPAPRVPAQYVEVRAWDNNGAGQPCQLPDVQIGTAWADANGDWSMNVSNDDTSGDGTSLDLYLQFFASTDSPYDGPMHTVRIPSIPLGPDSVYSWQTRPSTLWDVTTSVTYNAWINSNTTNHEAMWLLGDANRAWAYIHDNPWVAYNDPGPLHVFWQSGKTDWLPACSSSCFLSTDRSPNGYGVFISHTYVSAPDIAVHEIGHAYRYNVAGFYGSSCPQSGVHYIFDYTSSQCAWQEGWADFLPMQVNGGHCFDFYTTADCGAGSENLEAGSWGDGRPTGPAVEGRVAGALLDLHDRTNEGLDTANGYGFHRTWNIVDGRFDSAGESTLADFYAHWNSHGYGTDGPLLVPFYQNTIDYGVGLTNLPSVPKSYGGGGAATKAPGTWVSSLNLRNPGASETQGGVLFFDAAGSLAGSLSLGSDLPAGGSHSYFVPGIGGLANGAYAAVVASDPGPLQVVTNLTSSGPATAGAYSGLPASATGSDLWFSGLYKNYYGYNSELIIQNVDSASANNVAIAFYNASQNNPVALLDSTSNPPIPSIPVHASLAVALQDYAAVPSGNTNGLLSARVFSNSTLKLAGVANAWSAAFNSRFANYSGQVAGATRLYVPSLTKYYYNFVSSLTVQNLHPYQVASVLITYSNGVTATAQLAPHHAAAWYIPSNTSLPSGNAAGLFAATIDSLNGQPIAAIVNHQDTARGSLAIYNVPASAGTALDCPVVLKSYYGWFSSETVQNVGTAPTNIRITYSSGQSKVWNNVPINTPVNFIELDSAGSVLPNGSSVSARITSESGQPLAAIVQENSNDLYATTPGDYLLSYSCTPE